MPIVSRKLKRSRSTIVGARSTDRACRFGGGRNSRPADTCSWSWRAVLAAGWPRGLLSAACATFVVGAPLIATGALELRALLGALPSDSKCDKASLKLPPKEGRKESSAEVCVRATQPSLAASRPGRQGPATGRSPDRTAAQRRRTHAAQAESHEPQSDR